MRYVPIVLLVAACGGDDASTPQDAAVPDAPPDAYVCTQRELPAMLVEDTYLPEEACGSTMRKGEATELALGEGGTSRVLLRFALTPEIEAALADGTTTGATLTVTLRPNDCPCTNAPTTFEVYALTDGWNEGGPTGSTGANWCFRIGLGETAQFPWEVMGADGPMDRSQMALATREVSDAALASPGTVTIPLALDGALRTEVADRVVEGRLSLILVPSAGGGLYLYSREAMATATSLSFRDCR